MVRSQRRAYQEGWPVIYERQLSYALMTVIKNDFIQFSRLTVADIICKPLSWVYVLERIYTYMLASG